MRSVPPSFSREFSWIYETKASLDAASGPRNNVLCPVLPSPRGSAPRSTASGCRGWCNTPVISASTPRAPTAQPGCRAVCAADAALCWGWGKRERVWQLDLCEEVGISAWFGQVRVVRRRTSSARTNAGYCNPLCQPAGTDGERGCCSASENSVFPLSPVRALVLAEQPGKGSRAGDFVVRGGNGKGRFPAAAQRGSQRRCQVTWNLSRALTQTVTFKPAVE